jgi:hypothetical protein
VGSKVPAIELDLGFPPEKVDLAKRVAGKKVRAHEAVTLFVVSAREALAASGKKSALAAQTARRAPSVAVGRQVAAHSVPVRPPAVRPQVILVGLPGAFTPT